VNGNNARPAEMEISLHRWDEDSYRVEIRCQDPVNKVDFDPAYHEVEFDFDQLRSEAQNNDMEAYGRLLTERLFAPPIKDKFQEIRASLQARGISIRLRLYIGPSAPRLNSLRWETMRDPLSGEWLLTSQTILFSRYLSSQDFWPVNLRPESALKALVVIANPDGLGKETEGGYPDLPELNVEKEFERALKSFGNIPTTFLGDIPTKAPGDLPFTVSVPNERATLNNLSKRLRDEEYDILYLVCHGRLAKGGPRIYLENEEGGVDSVAGNELVGRLSDLENRPRLIVLASCQSAGTGDESRSDDQGALAALGPRLARAGIPAVLAMQGNIRMVTVSDFMKTFFEELRKDGRADRAMAVARGTISRNDESWIPTLFLRIADGRIWYVPGFASEEKFSKWTGLIEAIERRKCTPILGSGLLDPLVGSSRRIARHWAELHHFPMAPQNKEDLPQVAQYLTVDQGDFFTRSQLRKELSGEIIRRFGFPPMKTKEQEWTLSELVSKAGAILRARDPSEPHKILASLQFPLYITTNPDNLLVEALQETTVGSDNQKKNPRSEYCRWTGEVVWPPSIYANDSNYVPTITNPFVYYLFGSIDIEDSVVLSEDNYFDYLVGNTGPDHRIPVHVRRALSDSALLFLGFNLDDWDFRVLFRSIVGQGGSKLLRKYVHVAVQLNPEEGRLIDPERARKYLQERFQGKDIDISISIFWGSVDVFVRELHKEWNRTHPKELIPVGAVA
jgi:hypothetical protein